MEEVARALQTFWSGFGLPAYPEDNVPEAEDKDNLTALLPYITYTLARPEWSEPMAAQARVWYWSESYKGIMETVDAIVAKIGSGILLPAGDGYVCIRPSTPLVQFQPSEDYRLKIAYLNLQLNAYTN